MRVMQRTGFDTTANMSPATPNCMGSHKCVLASKIRQATNKVQQLGILTPPTPKGKRTKLDLHPSKIQLCQT